MRISQIVAVVDSDEADTGAHIIVGSTSGPAVVASPLKPRELLRRLTIIKYKRETEGKELVSSSLKHQYRD